MEDLKKVDIVRERTGASYERVVDALETADGEVLEAIIILEKEDNVKISREEFEVKGKEVVKKVKKLIKEGNIRRIKIKQKDRVILDIPITAGVLVTVLSPVLATIGAATALLTKCKIEVERSTHEVNTVDIDDDF